MAKIILESKEEFEHYHSEVSYTELIEGEVLYEVNNLQKLLSPGERVETAANQAHTITNIGQKPAIVNCYH